MMESGFYKLVKYVREGDDENHKESKEEEEEEKEEAQLPEMGQQWNAGAPIIASFSIVDGVAMPAESPEFAVGNVVETNADEAVQVG